jgi:hypothetical protein
MMKGYKTWIAAGGGKVLQVVTNIVATQASSSSSTYADTGITGYPWGYKCSHIQGDIQVIC